MRVAMALALFAFPPLADLKIGEPVPDVTLGTDSLAALTREGRVVALYFWSSDCPYGPPHTGSLRAAADKYADDAKVKILVVSSSGESEAKGQAWAKESGLRAGFIHDGGRKIARHFSARKVNATFVIDAKGNLLYRGGIATDKGNLLVEAIDAALSGRTAPASDQKFDGCGIRY